MRTMTTRRTRARTAAQEARAALLLEPEVQQERAGRKAKAELALAEAERRERSSFKLGGGLNGMEPSRTRGLAPDGRIVDMQSGSYLCIHRHIYVPEEGSRDRTEEEREATREAARQTEAEWLAREEARLAEAERLGIELPWWSRLAPARRSAAPRTLDPVFDRLALKRKADAQFQALLERRRQRDRET